MSCRRVNPLLEAFSDGELAAERAVEVELHLGDCERCRAQLGFLSALRASLKRSVSAEPSQRFEEQLRARLSVERAVSLAEQRRGAPLGWRAVVSVAAVAAGALSWGIGSQRSTPQAARSHEDASLASSVSLANVDQLIDQLVERHAENTDELPQITDTTLAPRFEPQVGVPVRVPTFQQYGMRWEGGSVIPVRNLTQAASFRYRLASHRVTLYVYDARRAPLRAKLEPRVVRNLPVYVGQRRGYSLAALEERGVGYAVASDLNDSETAELVASVR